MNRYTIKSAIIVVATLVWPFYNALTCLFTSTWPALIFALAALICAIQSYVATSAEATQKRPQWKYSHRVALAVSALAILLLLGLGLTLVQFPPGLVNPTELARLEAKQIAQRADSPPATAATSAPKATTLLDLYGNANPALVRRATEIASSRATSRPQGGVTLIIGPAGAGKTFLVPLLQSHLPGSQVVRLKKGEREDVPWKDRAQLLYLAPDGKEVAVSRMPNVEGDRETIWKSLIKFSGDAPAYLIIDDTDEVHPATMEALLKTIEHSLSAKSGTGLSCHIFLIGRPEAFRDFLTNPSRPSQFSDVVSVAGPSYDSQESLAVLIHAAAVFRVAGRKDESSLTPPEKKEIADFEAMASRNLPLMLEQHPWLRTTIQNLELANFICERAAETSQWDEHKLKGLIVGRMFDRARITHGRPAAANERYFNWFAEIAALRLPKLGTDNRLSFAVDPHQDRLSAGEGNAQVYAHEVLDYSGMAFLHPIRDSQRHYSFEPPWLHQHFVELHNQRIDGRCLPGRYHWYCLERIALGMQPLLGFALIVTVAAVGLRCLGPAAVDNAIDVVKGLFRKRNKE